jgi:uncharacterized membrane protein (DUF4010 family)
LGINLTKRKKMTLEEEFLKMVVISALVGGLLGVERELKVQVLAGTRTFMFASMLGALSIYVADLLGLPGLIYITFAGFLIITAILAIVKNFRSYDYGVTTPVAFIIAYILGMFAGMGLYFQAIAGSIIVTSILIFKKYTIWLSETLTHDEMRSALEFGIIAFVLYPVAPTEPIDPYGLIIPQKLLLIVIVVSSIGFAGFLALRRIGPERGLPVVGALGGLVSSFATTSALSIKAKKNESLIPNVIQGILYANGAMLLRNIVLAGVISLDVASIMALPLALMTAVGVLAVYTYSKRMREKAEDTELRLESPFAILPSIKFGVMFTIISVVILFIKDYGSLGVYAASILGGLVSSSVVVASMASMAASGSLDIETAASACILSSMSSTLNKILLVRISGPATLTRSLSIPAVISVMAGLISLLGVWFYI